MLFAWRLKSAVVKTLPIPRTRVVCIINSRHVSTLLHSQEKRQGASLLEPGGKQAPERRASCSTPRALPGGDQLFARSGLAKIREVLSDESPSPITLSLFPEDRCEGLVGDESVVRLKLPELEVRRPRQWGACWLALELWGQ